MSLRTKLTDGIGIRPKQVENKIETRSETKVDARVDAKVDTSSTSAPDQMQSNAGALSALRSLALQTKTPEKPRNKGAQSATLGAKLMSFARSEHGKKAAAIMSFGASMLGMAQTAQADVIHVGNAQGAQVTQVAQKIAKETGQPYVEVKADSAALEQVFERAEKGEVSLKHLILDYDDGKLPSSSEFQQLAQKYPKAAAQVEQVHVLRHNLEQNPMQSWSSASFPNAKAIVSFDLTTAMDAGPASAWVLENTTKAVDKLQPGLSAQDAQIQAKMIATSAAQGGVRTRVDIGSQSDVQAPTNALSTWLDEMTKNGASITRPQIETKLKELAASPEGLTDSMLGSLSSKIQTRGFKMAYDAARLASHVVDIRRAASTEVAVKALKDGNVHQVRHDLATKLNSFQYEQQRSAVFSKDVPRGIPVMGKEAIPTGGIQGQAFLVDGFGTIRNGEITVQAITHPTNGDGYQLTFKVGDGAGHKLEDFIAKNGGRLFDKTIVNMAPKDGRVVTVEKTDAVQATKALDDQQPEMSLGPALRVEKPGEYRLDYFAESISKQALRNEVHLQVYGKSDVDRRQAQGDGRSGDQRPEGRGLRAGARQALLHRRGVAEDAEPRRREARRQGRGSPPAVLREQHARHEPERDAHRLSHAVPPRSPRRLSRVVARRHVAARAPLHRAAPRGEEQEGALVLRLHPRARRRGEVHQGRTRARRRGRVPADRRRAPVHRAPHAAAVARNQGSHRRKARLRQRGRAPRLLPAARRGGGVTTW
jgi:hypothetical protein